MSVYITLQRDWTREALLVLCDCYSVVRNFCSSLVALYHMDHTIKKMTDLLCHGKYERHSYYLTIAAYLAALKEAEHTKPVSLHW